MTDHDDDLRALFRSAADRAKLRDEAEQRLLRSAGRRRRLVATMSTVGVLVLVGGVAGASMLWSGRVLKPAPPTNPVCTEIHYDVAVFVEDGATETDVEALRQELLADQEVRETTFVSKAQAYDEFTQRYIDQPEFWENLPRGALPASFRVSLVEGADAEGAARRFETLANVKDTRTATEMDRAPERAPGPGCPPDEQTFARYFFEAGSRDASAGGVLEVNAQEGTLCYEATVENVVASHLLRNTGVVAGGRRFERMIAATFFEPGEGPTPSAAGNVSMCLRGEELDELEDDLQVLIDQPDDFRVDLHRGPNDEPGLLAELVPQDSTEPCAGGPFLTHVPRKPVLQSERAPVGGECFQRHRRQQGPRVFLTANLGSDGRPLTKQELAQGRKGCELVAEARSMLGISPEGRMIGWFVPPWNGNCTKGASLRTHVALGPGEYGLAIGCPACHYANVRIGLPGDPESDPDERLHRLLTHCGLSFPMHYEGRNWLPVDPELRETINAPGGFSSDGYFDEGAVREVDHDTLIYISSGGQEVDYEPTDKPRGGCD
jgi:hypothetical protein